MKNLLLTSLLLGGVATQATGCIIETDDDDDIDTADYALITADWNFRTVSGTNLVCPAGFNTVELVNQPVDAQNRPVGKPIIDLFDCADFRGRTFELPPAVYQTWIRVTTARGGSVYAESLSEIIDVRRADDTFSATIIDDGGYFSFAWDLRGQQTNRPLTCGSNSDLDGIEIKSRISTSTALKIDQFDCAKGQGITSPLVAGTYMLSVDAFRDATPNDMELGTPTLITNAVIRAPNKVTDLGLVPVKLNNM